MARTYWLETLGCGKNEVDSEKLAARMVSEGLSEAADPASADVVVVNTCAFVAEAREESVATILDLHDRRGEGSELVVTGCMAQRYGSELADALPGGRPGQRLRGAGHAADRSRRSAGPRRARPPSVVRPVEPAATPGEPTVGVCQGRRGMRQGLRVLCHPVVPRSSAES
ncbi:MAG: hypothetical protein M5U19_15605 [Microthrixaceae bacterium]|nr:hypothetical protein [Microthrixaceae bacterium]